MKRTLNIKAEWERIRTSRQFHNVLMFLVFVAVATVFWFIIALNDNFNETFRVKLRIENVPDSVTFINDPPSEIHVTVRDRGTNILRSGVIKNPVVKINFNDYAHDGILRLSQSDLSSEIKNDLGGAATISSISIDSLKLYYSDRPGKRVPVIVQSDVTAASGYIISGQPVPLERRIDVYSYGDEVDTVQSVMTQKLVKSNLSSTSVYDVKIIPIAHVKIVPSTIRVKVPVEPLVKKEGFVTIEVENLPQNESLLLFPNKVPVTFYVPMSHFNDEQIPIHVVCDFNETEVRSGSKVSVRVKDASPNLINVELQTDSVDYTLVKH